MLLLPLGTIAWIEQTPPVGDVSPIFNTVSMIEIPRTREDGTLALDEPPIKVERIGVDFENPPPADAVPLIPISDTGQTILEDLAEQRSAFRVESFLRPLIPWAVGVWLVGVGVLSLRLFASWWSVRRLRCRATQPAGESWQALLRQLSDRLRVTRPVKLVESALVEVPAVIGWLRPVILLPAIAMTGLTTEQLEALLAHELAHVRRHDYLVNLLQTIVETLLFYHPAVWWVSYRIRLEREHCCDDLAASVCGDRLSYAKALVAMEELRAPKVGLAMSSNGGSLLTRVARLLGRADQQRRPVGWIAGLVSVVLIAAGALGAGLLTPPEKPTAGLPNDTQSTDSTGTTEETADPAERRGRETRAEREEEPRDERDSPNADGPKKSVPTVTDQIVITGAVATLANEPVADAEVFLPFDLCGGLPDDEHCEVTRTDQKGRYRFEVSSREYFDTPKSKDNYSFMVWALRPGMGMGITIIQKPKEVTREIATDIQLQPAQRFQVRVLDPDGEPVPDAMLWPSGIDTPTNQYPIPVRLGKKMAVRTNADGSAELTELPSTVFCLLRIETKKFGHQAFSIPNPQEQPLGQMTARLKQTARIRGVLREGPRPTNYNAGGVLLSRWTDMRKQLAPDEPVGIVGSPIIRIDRIVKPDRSFDLVVPEGLYSFEVDHEFQVQPDTTTTLRIDGDKVEIAASPAPLADDAAFRKTLHQLDAMRGQKSVEEIEAFGESLLKEFGDQPEQAARIRFQLAHVFAQSNIREHFARVRKYGEPALKDESDPDRRAMLHSYLASAALVDAGVSSFAEQRRKSVQIWLAGYRELLPLKLPRFAPEWPVVEKIGDVVGEERAEIEKRHAEQMEARRQSEFVRTMVAHRQVFARQIVEVYRREPVADDELRQLATETLKNQRLVDALLSEGLDRRVGEAQPRIEWLDKDDKRTVSGLRIEMVSSFQVQATERGLKGFVRIANQSPHELTAKLAHEWHGGEWPPTGLYASVTPWLTLHDAPFRPAYLFGENEGRATEPLTIPAGQSSDITVRLDWPGTGSVPATPLIDPKQPGKYRVRWLLVFDSQGGPQYVVSNSATMQYAVAPPANLELDAMLLDLKRHVPKHWLAKIDGERTIALYPGMYATFEDRPLVLLVFSADKQLPQPNDLREAAKHEYLGQTKLGHAHLFVSMTFGNERESTKLLRAMFEWQECVPFFKAFIAGDAEQLETQKAKAAKRVDAAENPSAGRGSPDPAPKPTEGLPDSGNANQREKTKEGDLRSDPAAESGNPRRAQAADAQLELKRTEQRIAMELNRPTEMEFTDTPLVDIAFYLGDYHNIPVVLDPTVPAEFVDAPVTMSLSYVELAEGLTLALHPLPLSYCIDEGQLLIATPAEIQRRGRKPARRLAEELVELKKADATIPWETLLRADSNDAAKTSIPKLIALLDHADELVRFRAARGLAWFGSASVA
ncbi:MAG: M56 family metallopeptidase, partial [Planctomycetaceae bacterium]|nr:M56 family metallopeptidase [Planctomycetaceae bacterium]